MTLIQRFGSALNLNIHFHMLFLDGVYFCGSNGHPMRFLKVKAPTKDELIRLTDTIARRVGRYLERHGLLERDTGNIFLTQEAVDASDEDPSNQLLGSSITYRIAVGRAKLERLCRYITRPPVSTKRMSITRNGRVRYELKTPWRNGTTHVIFEPLDFMFRTNGMPRAQGAQERPFPDWFPLFPNQA